jgi:ribosomal protein S18 acetylase RimI-like enzyme
VSEEIRVRKFKVNDRAAVREINYSTALLGDSAVKFFDDQEIFTDALTRYFTDYEPQSCFVAESGSAIAGYLIGAKDTRVMDQVIAGKIILPLVLKAFFRGMFFKPKNIIFLLGCVRSFVRGEFFAPSFHKDYPATLHINLREGFRGQALGGRLIEAYLNYLKSEGVKGVHLCTMADKAAEFFTDHGFTLLHERKRSYFRSYLGRDVIGRVFGKKISLC